MQCVCGQNWCEAWDVCSSRPRHPGHRLPGSPPEEDRGAGDEVAWPVAARTAMRWRAADLGQDPLRPGYVEQSPSAILHAAAMAARRTWTTSALPEIDLDSTDADNA